MTSFKIGSFGGIAIRLHITFPLVLIWAAFQWGSGRGLSHAAFGVLLVVLLFVCVVLHELGHSFVARSFGVNVKDIVLLPIGGLAQLRTTLDDPKEELLVAVAGPAVNVGIAAALLPFFLLIIDDITSFGFWRLLDQANLVTMTIYLFLANVSLVVFNLVPAFPMDGGRVFRSFLAFFLPYERATWVAVRLGQMLALVFAAYGLFRNPFLLLIGAFIFIAANAELNRVATRDALVEVEIGPFVQQHGRALRPEQSVFAAKLMMEFAPQHVWPVVQQGRLVGLVSHDQLSRGKTALRVEDIMDREYPVLHPRSSLYEAQQLLLSGDAIAAAVIDDGLFVGPFSLQDLARAIRGLRV